MANSKSRRKFIELGLKVGITLPFLTPVLSSCISKQEDEETNTNLVPEKLKILILGGTSFLGPHQIAYAISRGHSISIFTRGKTKPSIHKSLFNKVEQLIGNRENDLTALYNRKWDVVIDNSGHNAEWTKKSAELLKENCELYLYTSSTGVFYPYVNSDFKEDSKVNLIEPVGITDEEVKLEYWYGTMKANSELEAIKQFGIDNTIIVRPTYMIGPADKSNRFIHWPIRLERGGEIMIPGKVDDMVQYIDVRDVAEFMIRLIEDKKGGTYNAVGPSTGQNIYSFAEEAKKTFNVEASFTKIDDYDFLIEHNIHYIVPWVMPIGNNEGSSKINNQKGKENGLKFRPLTESVKDTFEWWNSDAVSQKQRDEVELDPESILVREKSILKKWKTKQQTSYTNNEISSHQY